MQVMDKLKVTAETESDRLRLFIDKLHEIHVTETSDVRRNETNEPFNYETWYCDCPEGTYLKDKKKVRCRTSIKSIVAWQPKNRLIEPQVCDDCFTRISYGTYAGFQDWMQRKKLNNSSGVHRKDQKEWNCLRGLDKPSRFDIQQVLCTTCKVKHFDKWRECQERKRGLNGDA